MIEYEERMRLQAYIRRLERIKEAAMLALEHASPKNINSLRQAVEGEALLTEAMGFPPHSSSLDADQNLVSLLAYYGIPTEGLSSVEVEIGINQIAVANVTRCVGGGGEYPLLGGAKLNPTVLLEIRETFELLDQGMARKVSQSVTPLTPTIGACP